jgi:WD40 repeat protein
MPTDAPGTRRPASFRGIVVLSAAIVVASGCGGGGGSTEPGGGTTPPNPRFKVIAGGAISDTIEARPTQALTVEIRDSTGQIATGRTVRFEALPSEEPGRTFVSSLLVSPLAGSSFTPLATDVTDSFGRAKTLLAFGPVAGTARVRVAVPEFGTADTVSYTVKPGAPFRIIIGVRDTTVQPGASYALRASLADRFSNPTTGETPTYTATAGITSVSSTGQVTAGSAIARGHILLTWRTLTDSAHVTVMPRLLLVANHGVASGRAVATVNSDGTGVSDLVITSHSSIAPHSVSSTTSVVYYQADPEYNATLWIVAPGSAGRLLVGPANGFASAAWPAWSPDGNWVYFTGVRSNTYARSLWRIRPDGTGLDSLGVYTRTSRWERVTVSPDGATAAVAGDGGVKLVNVATKSYSVIAAGCEVPRYSPDGRQFACLINEQLAVMNVDGTGVRIIPSFDPIGFGNRYEEYAGVDWSPDGNWLIAQSSFRGIQLVKVSDGRVISLPALTGSFSQAAFVR